MPISQFVLKVHSRCDLACDHCYVYRQADQNWRRMPLVMPAESADWAGRRIAEHAVAHHLPEVCVILHGGEPLLLGVPQARTVLETLHSRLRAVPAVDLRIVTNGVRLNEEWCELFAEFGVMVGVSLDGDQAANDRHRRFRNGQGSYAHVNHALSLLRKPAFRHLYAGILCTIDIANDPEAVYDALMAQAPPRLDLLLPHATWCNPPGRPARPGENAGRRDVDTAYADWLLRIYWRWTQQGRPVPIRLFDSLLSAARGGPSFTEALGTDAADLLVIDTDGSWAQPDSMKTVRDGADATGMQVTEHTVDEVIRHPQIAARQGGLAALCATCRACPVVGICGGGLYAHRYGPGGFGNPSVYCADLKELITNVIADERVAPAPAARAGPAAGALARRPARRPVHALPAGGFAALAAGPGDLAAMREISQVWLSEARALVAAVANGGNWRDAQLQAAAGAGWKLLHSLDKHHSPAVRQVLAHPSVWAWAVRCLHPAPGTDLDLDRAHLAGLALAVAARAGVNARLPVPVHGGWAHLPSVGAMAVAPHAGRVAMLRVRNNRVITGGTGRWRPVRQLDAGELRGAVIEDLDPFRDHYQRPAADRLSVAQWRAWCRALTAAGRILAEAVPSYLNVMTEGLRAVIPLRANSGAAQPTAGSVAIALPASDDILAELLLHEFQQVKLDGLDRLHPMFSARSRPVLLPVPWRPDRRPVADVLHGAYAFLAMMDLRRAIGPGQCYRHYQSWVLTATESLLASGALTTDGQRFAAGIAAAAGDGPG